MDLDGHTIRTVANDLSDTTGAGGNAARSPSSDTKITKTTVYDGFGRATDVTDERGVITHAVYDALSRPVTATADPTGLNVQTTFAYNLAGDRYNIRQPGGRIDLSAFDAMHRVITSTVSYLPNQLPDWQTNIQTLYTYDSQGRQLTVQDPLGRVTSNEYDMLGRQVRQWVNYVANGTACGQSTDAQTNVCTQRQYDKAGEVVSQISPRHFQDNPSNPNLVTAYSYDAQGRLVQVTDDASAASGHLNLLTSYAYDPNGNELTMTDGNGNVTRQAFNSLGRLVSVTDASGNVVQYQYSPAGEITGKINGRGQQNSLLLDGIGRTLNETYLTADQTSASYVFGYDAAGLMTSFCPAASSTLKACPTPSSTTTIVAYDAVRRVSTVSAPSVATYTYWTDGALRSVTDAVGQTQYGEDRLGRLSSTQDPLEAVQTFYNVDQGSRLTKRTEASGLVTVFQYTSLDQLQKKTMTAGATTLGSWDMSVNASCGTFAGYSGGYDLAGNRVCELSSLTGDPKAGQATFAFDSANRLASSSIPTLTTMTYTYDAAQNRLTAGSASFAYASNSALTTEGSINYNPDQDGNLRGDSAAHVLRYDSLNRLQDVCCDAQNANNKVIYSYDALGRVITRTDGAIVTQFVYRGIEKKIVQELNASSAIQRSYVWDANGRNLAVQIVGVGTYTIANNPHGDIVALMSGTVVIGTVHYDAWGVVVGPWTGTASNAIPFGYQSAYTDPFTNFVLMGARWYDPHTGRFITEDPRGLMADAVNPLDENPWAYAMDDPVRYVDPLGLWPWDNVVKTVSNAWNSATQWVSNAWNTVTSYAEDAWSWAEERASRFIRDTGDAVNRAVNQVTATVQYVARRAFNAGRQLLSYGRRLVTRIATRVASAVRRAVGNVARAVSATARVVGNVAKTVGGAAVAVASAVGHAAKAAWDFCTGSVRGASTCLAVAGSVALIASGVGAGAGVGLLATTLFTASSLASAVSFAQTGDPMDLLGAIPAFGEVKDVELGAQLASHLAPEAETASKLVSDGARAAEEGGHLKPLVIGENMDRVREYAQQIGGHAYQAWQDGASEAVALARNGRMIKDAIRAGRDIIDIGPDFARRAAGRVPSRFYNLERKLTKGYDGYTKVFQRFGRLEGGVPGLDF
jgi:RHS repeat-associated protein